MNCERVNFILDSKEAEALTAAERQAVEQHFASCRACREGWAAYREVAALEIPSTPKHLRARLAAALAEGHGGSARRVRRSVVIGSVLLVGAAAAAVVTLRFITRAPAEVAVVTEQPAAAVLDETESRPVANENLADGPSSAGARGLLAQAARATPYPLDRFSVVVLVTGGRTVGSDAASAAAVAICRDGVLRALRGIAGLNVIADERVTAFADTGLSPTEIARALGAGSIVVMRGGPPPSCGATYVNAANGDSGPTYVVFVGPGWQTQWQQFVAAVEERVIAAVFKDQPTLIAEARAAVLNTALDDRERASALYKLGQDEDNAHANYDEAVVAAAVQIGMASRDAEARENTWMALRGLRDESLIPPLLYVLVNDPAEQVRGAAARALGQFLDEPGVRDALARAAAEDPSEHPSGPCCRPTVRETARLALLTGEEPRAAVLQILMNAELSPHERMLMSSPDGRYWRLSELGDEAARAVFELGSAARDSATRATAWRLLQSVREPDFTRVLLEDLTEHPAEEVRTAAAGALWQYREDPNVRAALERAKTDASATVQRAARAALESSR